MSSTTTAPAMAAALVTQLSARAGLSGVTVNRDPVGTLSGFYEAVLVSGPVANTMQPVNQGMGNVVEGYREDYTKIIYVSVVQNTDDGSQTEDRAYTLLGEVEKQIHSDPTVNGTIDAAWLDGYDAAAKATANVKEHFIALRLKCVTFIGG